METNYFDKDLLDLVVEIMETLIISCEDYDGDLVVEEEAYPNLDFGEYPEDDEMR